MLSHAELWTRLASNRNFIWSPPTSLNTPGGVFFRMLHRAPMSSASSLRRFSHTSVGRSVVGLSDGLFDGGGVGSRVGPRDGPGVGRSGGLSVGDYVSYSPSWPSKRVK